VHIETGEIFHGSKPTGTYIKKKTLNCLRERLRGAGLMGVTVVVLLTAPEIVQAAEEGGVAGVATYTGDLAVTAAVSTGQSAAVGGMVVGGASLAGTSVTVGGTAVTTAVGATGVGAAVIGVGTIGYGVGYGVGSIPIGGQPIHEHIGTAMYWVGHGASSVWNWISD
jgi:hypothetical protein